MAVDPLTYAAGKFFEGGGRQVVEELAKEARAGSGSGLLGLFGLFGRRKRSRLNDLDAAHAALTKFSIGTEPVGGGSDLGELPETAKGGYWKYQKNSSLEALFDDVFRERVMDNRASVEISAIMAQWKALDRAGVLHYWKADDEFRLDDKGPGEHKTVKCLFPFVSFGIYDKSVVSSIAATPPLTTIMKMFIDGWIAFIDEKTDFEPRIILAIGNQAYLDGDFTIEKVYFTYGDHYYQDRLKDNIFAPKLDYYRRLMVTETKSKILVCMVGVPHIEVPADQTRTASPAYARAESLFGGIKILRDF